MSGIVRGDQIREDVVLTPDLCVVGSGPGGAIVASRLADAGAEVVVLEEGGHYTKADFDMQEATAYPHLYQDRGNRATADLSIAVLQGRQRLDHRNAAADQPGATVPVTVFANHSATPAVLTHLVVCHTTDGR